MCLFLALGRGCRWGLLSYSHGSRSSQLRSLPLSRPQPCERGAIVKALLKTSTTQELDRGHDGWPSCIPRPPIKSLNSKGPIGARDLRWPDSRESIHRFPELLAERHCQETAKGPKVEGSRSYQSSATALFTTGTRAQNTCFTVFRCNQRGADEPWPISADFLNPRLSGLLSFF